MNATVRIFAPSRAAWRLLPLAALALLAIAGCGDSPTAPVVVLPPLSRVVISSAGDTTVTQDTLTIGGTRSYGVTVRDTGNAVVNASVTWISTNPQVFSVIKTSGVVTAQGEGTATLVASIGGVSDSVEILVLPAALGWVQQTSNSSASLNGVFMRPDGRFGCVVGDGGELLTTSNAGGTWTRRASNTAFNLNAVWFITNSLGYAVGNSGTILRTTNGGVNWTLVPAGASENLRDVFFAHPDTGFVVGTAGAILRTVDGGATWQKQNPTSATLHGVAFSSPRYGWAVGDNGTIVGTVDRGLNWTVLSPSVTSSALRAE